MFIDKVNKCPHLSIALMTSSRKDDYAMPNMQRFRKYYFKLLSVIPIICRKLNGKPIYCSLNLEKTLHKFGHKRVLTVYFTRKRHYFSVFAKRQLFACFIFSWRRWLDSLEILKSYFL